jgi:hypothetical protein
MAREKVELATLSGGAAAELFEASLKKTIDNVRDCNTTAKTVRTITMTLKIKPSEDRMTAETELSVNTKLAGLKPFSKSMYFGKDEGGNLSAFEENPKQETLQFPAFKEA